MVTELKLQGFAGDDIEQFSSTRRGNMTAIRSAAERRQCQATMARHQVRWSAARLGSS
jgi:hypothetical protein